MRSLAVCALLALLALPLAGLEPYLVKDVNPVPGPASSEPAFPAAAGGAVLFFAHDGSDWELWRSDGTSAGTWPVTEGTGGELADSRPFLATGRLYFFVVQHSSLWVSDGTPAGTFRLTEPGVRVEQTARLWVEGQGVLYFLAYDADHGVELWRSDGTSAGTRLVADLRPGSMGAGIRSLVVYRGRVWFGADDGQRGGALWSTDGTAAGTRLALDPVPSSKAPGIPDQLRVVGGRLAFFAQTPARRRQLWAGDGTARGTAPVTFLPASKALSLLEEPVVHGNRLYFAVENKAVQELWASDGTARGTRRLAAFPRRTGVPEPFVSLPPQQGLDRLFFFWANDAAHGFEPRVTDGTEKGTRLLRDVCPGSCSSQGSLWGGLAGRLYFSAEEPSLGREVWSTDGTREGTRRVADLCPGGCGSHPYAPFAVGGQLLFVARDFQIGGDQLWSTDGTEPGTVRVSDFIGNTVWSHGFHGAVLDGQLLFRGGDDRLHGTELWSADGTPAGTRLVEDINRTDHGGSFPRRLRPLGDEAVFAADVDGVQELWKSDGTAAGTTRVRAFGLEEREGAEPRGAFAEAGADEGGGRLFYFAYDAAGDRYLPWRTDGTAAGTFRLAERELAGCCRAPAMAAVGSTVFFDLWDEEHGRELWVSDGTREGTRLVLDIVPGVHDSEPRDLTAFQGKLFFTAGSSDTDRQLWRSDGTAAGTVPLVTLATDDTGSVIPLLTVHAGRLWFFAKGDGWELWSSDGTEAGSRLEVELGGSFWPELMVSLGDRLVLSVHFEGLLVLDGMGTRKIDDEAVDIVGVPHAVFQGRLYYVSGGTLRVTDGTETGTGPMLDREGREIGAPPGLAVLGDRLVLMAPEGPGVHVLWESDGTPAGTFPIEPPTSPVSQELVRAGNRVFFPAYDSATGFELWAVRP